MGELLLKGFIQSKNDYSLFIKHSSKHITILIVYVDDIIITGNDIDTIHDIKMHLDDIFSIKDLGKLTYFLGIEIGYLSSGISLTQKKFIREMLLDADITTTKTVITPLPINLETFSK